MKCDICKQDTITIAGTCSNVNCKSNAKRELTSLDILESHIDMGTPPDTVGTELDNKGIIRTVFRWGCGTFLHLRYEFAVYSVTVTRFMDFWGTCLPGGKLDVKEKKEGTGGGK